MQKIVLNALNEASIPLTRQQRRLVKAQKGRKQLVAGANLATPPELKGLGFTQSEFARLFVNPVRHRKKFTQRVLSLLTDPRHYSEMVASVRPGENPLAADIGHRFHKITKSIQDSFDSWRELIEKQKALLSKTDELLARHKGNAAVEAELRAMKRKAKGGLKEIKITDSKELSAPRFAFLDTYVNRMLNISKRPLSSETLDLLHLFYAEDVDLIRVDKRLFEILKTDVSVNEKLVRRIDDLPELIEKRHVAKAHP